MRTHPGFLLLPLCLLLVLEAPARALAVLTPASGNAPVVAYYGYRYYDAVNGRWTSRDPIEERGGNCSSMLCTACSRLMLCESEGVGEPMLTSTVGDRVAAGTEELPALVALPGPRPDEQPAATTATHPQTAHHRLVMSIRVSACAAGSRHRRAVTRPHQRPCQRHERMVASTT